VTLTSFSRYSKRAGRHVRHVSPQRKRTRPAELLCQRGFSCGESHRVGIGGTADRLPHFNRKGAGRPSPSDGPRWLRKAEPSRRALGRIHRDYAARAIMFEAYAERAISPSLTDSWRRVAKSYWALARQQTEMKYRREVKRMSDEEKHQPGDRAPVTAHYEELNVFGSPTGAVVMFEKVTGFHLHGATSRGGASDLARRNRVDPRDRHCLVILSRM
jgi:hypothetical protein